MNQIKQIEGSFRDPSGCVYEDEKGILRRKIFPIYFDQYEALKTSKLFEILINSKSLIPHKETKVSDDEIIITPQKIPFITNPYEWSFLQYKQAALLTLRIHKKALEKGFILKDASAYNVTFFKGKSIFIDTLSFDFYVENTPWRAYKQFVMHFFGPLVLAKYHGSEVLKLMQLYIDGIPLKLLSSMLPKRTKLSPTLFTNIHLLAKNEEKYNDDYQGEIKTVQLSKKSHIKIIENLYTYIKDLKLKEQTEWGDYYSKTNYNSDSLDVKHAIVKKWISEITVRRMIDVGGNDGTFVRGVIDKVSEHAIVTDIDSVAINKCFIKNLKTEETKILTFVSDILQPSPGIGFDNNERSSIIRRFKEYKPCVTMALALIHHITLSGNVPFYKSAEFFASFSNYLIIEFPKREDSWVNSLLKRKREFINHFDDYNIEKFEKSYLCFFELLEKKQIKGTSRILFLFKIKK